MCLRVQCSRYGVSIRPRPVANWSRRPTAPNSKAEAAQSSHALAVQSAYELKAAKRWSYVTMSARRVKGDPFWKTVRPVVPPTLISSLTW